MEASTKNSRLEIASREYIEQDFVNWDEQDNLVEENRQKKIMKFFKPIPVTGSQLVQDDRKVLWKEVAQIQGGGNQSYVVEISKTKNKLYIVAQGVQQSESLVCELFKSQALKLLPYFKQSYKFIIQNLQIKFGKLIIPNLAQKLSSTTGVSTRFDKNALSSDRSKINQSVSPKKNKGISGILEDVFNRSVFQELPLLNQIKTKLKKQRIKQRMMETDFQSQFVQVKVKKIRDEKKQFIWLESPTTATFQTIQPDSTFFKSKSNRINQDGIDTSKCKEEPKMKPFNDKTQAPQYFVMNNMGSPDDFGSESENESDFNANVN